MASSIDGTFWRTLTERSLRPVLRWRPADSSTQACGASYVMLSGVTPSMPTVRAPVTLRRVTFEHRSLTLSTTEWYEYNIQEDYITHLYLPEHVVLNAIPKPANYTKPAPLASDVPMKHSHVRARMARANDEGVGKLHLCLLIHLADLHRCP